jgi:hypothetical protein
MADPIRDTMTTSLRMRKTCKEIGPDRALREGVELKDKQRVNHRTGLDLILKCRRATRGTHRLIKAEPKTNTRSQTDGTPGVLQSSTILLRSTSLRMMIESNFPFQETKTPSLDLTTKNPLSTLLSEVIDQVNL